MGLIFAPFMLYTLYAEYVHGFLTVVAFELGAAVLIWIIWLASTAAATNVWPDLSFCVQFRACTNLQAMIAFAYLGWICLTLIMLITTVSATRNRAWREHAHGAWSDRLLFGHTPGMRTSDFGPEGSASASAAPQMRAAESV
ncbi:hypothetical protein JB92DRAFT_2901028 [Gautieria morchelliformis]|nr:hypothetical protein JB92DRAFT_2901028 [Gautieria morchelliformis]